MLDPLKPGITLPPDGVGSLSHMVSLVRPKCEGVKFSFAFHDHQVTLVNPIRGPITEELNRCLLMTPEELCAVAIKNVVPKRIQSIWSSVSQRLKRRYNSAYEQL